MVTGPSKMGRSSVWLAVVLVLGLAHSVCLVEVFGLLSVAASRLGGFDVCVAVSVDVGKPGRIAFCLLAVCQSLTCAGQTLKRMHSSLLVLDG